MIRTPQWFLTKNWRSGFLLPLSVIYNFVNKTVCFLRKTGQKSSKKPVICIGNIMAGGVGKTPVVREIATHFKNSAILMRGFGGNKFGRVLLSDSADIIGDEAKMLSKTSDVFVGSNRAANIPLMQKYNLIIMDDGFQNPTVKKDLSILVFDGSIGIGNGRILPAGPLRESLKSGIKKADAVLIIGKDETKLSEKISKIKNIPIFYAVREFEKLKSKNKITVFSGIGYPDKFFNSMKEIFGNKIIKTIAFPDHYKYNNEDVKKLSEIAQKNKSKLWTTEKDFVRLQESFTTKVNVLQMGLNIDKKFYKFIEGKLWQQSVKKS